MRKGSHLDLNWWPAASCTIAHLGRWWLLVEVGEVL